MTNEPSAYEVEAIKRIHAWKHPTIGWFGWAIKTINWPIERAFDAAVGNEYIAWVLEKTFGGLVSLLNDVAHTTVRPETIYKEFREAGHEVSSPQDIFELDLQEVDRVLGWLDVKYKGVAFVEGGGTGVVGLPGIPVDVVAIIGMNQRAIGEYATYCGFDISSQEERLFAMNVLALASSPDDLAKQVAMAQLVKIAKEVAAKKTFKVIDQHLFVKIIRRIAEALSIRLTKAKLAQAIPAVGAVVGAGFNAYFTQKVCEAAFFLYRERFLAEKYGADIIERTVDPAESFTPEYSDAEEFEEGTKRAGEDSPATPEVPELGEIVTGLTQIEGPKGDLPDEMTPEDWKAVAAAILSMQPWPLDHRCTCGEEIRTLCFCTEEGIAINIKEKEPDIPNDAVFECPKCRRELITLHCEKCKSVYSWQVGVVQRIEQQ